MRAGRLAALELAYNAVRSRARAHADPTVALELERIASELESSFEAEAAAVRWELRRAALNKPDGGNAA